MLSFFPRDVLDEIWDLIESVSEGFPTYSCVAFNDRGISIEKHEHYIQVSMYRCAAEAFLLLLNKIT